MLKNQKLFIVKLILFGLVLVLFTGCHTEEEEKGWVLYEEPPPPPQIVELSSFIKNCVSPYSVSFSHEIKNKLGNVNYFWDFGDGDTSTFETPTHIYDSIGVFEVMLIASNELGADTEYVVLKELNQTSIPVETNFSYEYYNDNNFAPAKIIFSNESYGSNFFKWNFGDGDTSTLEEPTHIFMNAGNYNVTLTGVCTDDNLDVITQQVDIDPSPSTITIDSLDLMLNDLVASLRTNIYLELYHDTTYISRTHEISFEKFPYKFKANDFIEKPIFKFVSFDENEKFKFLVRKGEDKVIHEMTLNSINIQKSYYPKKVSTEDSDYKYVDLYISY